MTKLLIIQLVLNFCLLLLGKIWNNVWGKDSDGYSRKVIRNYLCSQEIAAKQKSKNDRQLNIVAIAALHRGGHSKLRPHRNFGVKVANLIGSCKFITFLYCIT